MKIEITYDNNGNVLVTDKNGQTKYFFCEWESDINKIYEEHLKDIIKYKN
jgi:hypothetical protein